MKQYINKSALMAEVESKIKEWRLGSSSEAKFRIEVYKELSEWLNTLEVKKVENFIWNNARTTVPEDSTNQIICIKEDGLAVSTIGKIVNGTVKWAYLDDLLNTNSFNIEVKEVNLEKEIRRYRMNNPIIRHREESLYDYITNVAKHFYELGLKAQKRE